MVIQPLAPHIHAVTVPTPDAHRASSGRALGSGADARVRALPEEVPVDECLDRAHWHLPPPASIGRRRAARDARVCIALASLDVARGVTSTFNASRAFHATGLVASMRKATWQPVGTRLGGGREEGGGIPAAGSNPTGSRVLSRLSSWRAWPETKAPS
jgi:hypothetical protein